MGRASTCFLVYLTPMALGCSTRRLMGVPCRPVGRDAIVCRLPSGFGGCVGATLLGVSAERDELRRLVEQLSDDRVPAVLAEARRQSGSALSVKIT